MWGIDASLIAADAGDRTRVEGAAGLPPEAASRAVKEYLAVLDDAAFGAASEVTPKFIAPADPAARWTAAHRGPAFFAYSTNYLIDVDNAIIVDVEATTAIRQAEVLAAKRMVERSMEHFDLYPERLIGDTAYGSAEMLDWLVHDRGIEPHIPVYDKSQRSDGTFSRDDFSYDEDQFLPPKLNGRCPVQSADLCRFVANGRRAPIAVTFFQRYIQGPEGDPSPHLSRRLPLDSLYPDAAFPGQNAITSSGKPVRDALEKE